MEGGLGLQDIAPLMEFVSTHWQFNEDEYESLRGKSPLEAEVIALRHILQHMAKAIGRLSAVTEPLDHRLEEPNRNELLKVARNSLINAIRLAEVAGIAPDEFNYALEQWASDIDGK